jgi:hypothetical protein
VHHGCGTTLWKHGGDRPPKLSSARPRSSRCPCDMPKLIRTAVRRFRFARCRSEDRKKCPWLEKLEAVSVGHRVSLLRWRTEGTEHPATAATRFHAVTNFRPPVSEIER